MFARCDCLISKSEEDPDLSNAVCCRIFVRRMAINGMIVYRNLD